CDRVTRLGDHGVNLMSGQLAAFARLGALGDLDLQLVGVDEVLGGHTEPRRRDLLDSAVALGAKPLTLFTALAAVAASAESVHGDGECLMCLGAERAERHRTGAEAAGDGTRRLDLIDRNWLALDELQQVAQGRATAGLVVGELAEFLERRVVVAAGGVLELGDGERIPVVMLA